MKKITILFALCLPVILGVLFSGCTEVNGYAPSMSTRALTAAPEITPQTVAQTVQSATGVISYEYETQLYEDGGIRIQYPKFTDLSAAQEGVNQLIQDAALKDLSFISEEPGTVSYELDYEVTLAARGLISVKFIGYSYSEGAAHPYGFLNTVNIDVAAVRAFKMTDLVRVDGALVAVFQNGTCSSSIQDMTPEYQAALEEYLSETDGAGWMGYLSGADDAGENNTMMIHSYLTEDALIASVSIPHVMGDYCEIMMKYADLGACKKDSPLWENIG